MIIGISGAQNTGKSTFIKEFINNWPKYKSPILNYRKKLADLKLEHSSNTNEETQLIILESMLEQIKKHKEDDEKYLIYDRTPLDLIPYTLAANEKGEISDEVTTNIILAVKESLEYFDIIFVTKFDDSIKPTENGVRDTDIEYIKKIDGIFSAMIEHYLHDYDEESVFFPGYGKCPGIIDFQTMDYLKEAKSMINVNGDLMTEQEAENQQLDLNSILANQQKIKAMTNNVIMDQVRQLPNNGIIEYVK